MSEKHRCENFHIHKWQRVNCQKEGKYFEDGHWYCGIHAPSKREERSEARSNSRQNILNQLEKAEMHKRWAEGDIAKWSAKLAALDTPTPPEATAPDKEHKR